MMKNRLASRLVVFISMLIFARATFGQGSLIPPGAPAPTMKTLDQVEPRTAITNLPINITQGGSYYLTQSFVQSFSSTAISISASNVTLDLCGFTVQQTGSATVSGVNVELPVANVSLRNIVLKNGFITGFGTGGGISCLGVRNCVFEKLTITQCVGSGMSFQSFGTAGAVGNVVRNCRLCDNSGSGVVFLTGSSQNVIQNCEALNNSSAGFSLAAAANLIVNCRASGNVNNYVIAANNREGIIVQPAVNASSISGATGGSGTGTTDPYANLSY